MKKCILKLVLLLALLTPSINAVADIPTWLVGSWTDGELVVEITSSQQIRIYENKILIKEGTFSCWNDFLDITWSKDLKPSDECSFVMITSSDGSYLAHEGGSNLQKLPGNFDIQNENEQQNDYYGELNSSDVIENSKRYWKDISWAYGEWQIPANHISGQTYAVKITPLNYPETTACGDSTIIFSELPKPRYKVMEGEHITLGTVVYIDNLYLDLTSKRLYLSNLDNKIYLEQTVEYATTTAKVIFWIIAIIIGLVVLGALFILVRMLIRILISCVRKITDWVRNCWKNVSSFILNKGSEVVKKANLLIKAKGSEVGKNSNFKRYGIIILCALSMWGLSRMCSGGNNDFAGGGENGTDYSWVYGTWASGRPQGRHYITLRKNGTFTDEYEDWEFGGGTIKGKGTFTIQGSSIKFDYSDDDYPTYIEIEGQRLKSDGHYYRKY